MMRVRMSPCQSASQESGLFNHLTFILVNVSKLRLLSQWLREHNFPFKIFVGTLFTSSIALWKSIPVIIFLFPFQNLFHYLCEQAGGSVKLPDAKGVSVNPEI